MTKHRRIDFDEAVKAHSFESISATLADFAPNNKEVVRLTGPASPGLMVVIRADGIKWMAHYAVAAPAKGIALGSGGRRQMVIGTYPEMTLEAARKVTRALINRGKRGDDPFDHDRIVRALEVEE